MHTGREDKGGEGRGGERKKGQKGEEEGKGGEPSTPGLRPPKP